jgi:tripartite ATP-independent transporter DctM subunit
MAGALMAAVAVIAARRDFPVEAPVALPMLPGITLRALPTLLLPVILLGGIYGGATTPTEAASIAAAYALLLAVFGYRALGLGDLLGIFVESARAGAMVALIIGGAFVFNYVIASEQIPNALAAWLATVDMPPLAFMLLVNLLFLLFGCFLDATTMLLVLVPLILPALHAMQLDLVHFGVVIVVNMMIGLITPPYGVLLFVINGLTGIPLRDMIRELWPFILILLATLLLIVLVPETVLWLPRRFGYEG